jgi:hypothetical protein
MKQIFREKNIKTSITFAKNKDHFESLIQNDDFLVFSLTKIRFGEKKCKELIRKFNNLKFHCFYISDDKEITDNEIMFMAEKNVEPKQYTTSSIISELQNL